MKKTIKTNFVRTIPVMTGYLVLGFGFGIVFASKGYNALWALFMSVFVFAGSMQFVAVDLIATGAGMITVAITTLMVNARHIFYGLSMIDRYKNAGKVRPYLMFGLSDETYSLICGNEDLTSADMFCITLMDQLYWIIGSVLGGLVGTLVPWDFTGVDFALTALFVSIVVDQWLKTKDHIPALIGIFSAVVCLLIFGASNFLIPTMILIAVLLTVLRMVRKEEPANE